MVVWLRCPLSGALDGFGDIRDDGNIGGFDGHGDFDRVDFGLVLVGVRHRALPVMPGMKMNGLEAMSSSDAFKSITSSTRVADSVSARRDRQDELLAMDPLPFIEAGSLLGLDSLRDVVLLVTGGAVILCRIDCDLVTRLDGTGALLPVESSSRRSSWSRRLRREVLRTDRVDAVLRGPNSRAIN
jgi:hypothetical protein